MINFTSSLYLGFRHASGSLCPWAQLTTGVPAALADLPEAAQAAACLARLQGCAAALLAPSTLHLFWDLFGMLARERPVICLDGGAYPIAQWGVERAAAMGAAVKRFAHHDPQSLEYKLSGIPTGRRVVVVADGICACCGQPAPIRAYRDLVRQAGGLLVLDDTQAFGLLGHSRGPRDPYGQGGGGSLRFAGVQGPEIVLITSLAKGFGAPLALLSGSRALVRKFVAQSETRSHCSPPSRADIHSALLALEINAACGDTLRRKLAANILLFRKLAEGAGLSLRGGLSPVQTLEPVPGLDVSGVYRQLLQRGIQTLLRKGSRPEVPLLSFILTARHDPAEIEQAVNQLVETVKTRVSII